MILLRNSGEVKMVSINQYMYISHESVQCLTSHNIRLTKRKIPRETSNTLSWFCKGNLVKTKRRPFQLGLCLSNVNHRTTL